MVGQEPPLHRAGDIVLRIRRYEAAQDADVVRAAEDRPLFALAGLWTPWRGVRGPKSAPVEGNHELFGFLTTEANAVVAPIHPKAMPVILRSAEEADRWLEAETADALALQRPLPDDALRIVAKGEREDASPQS
jgi:putative SOS response-associated peptidase YedK